MSDTAHMWIGTTPQLCVAQPALRVGLRAFGLSLAFAQANTRVGHMREPKTISQRPPSKPSEGHPSRDSYGEIFRVLRDILGTNASRRSKRIASPTKWQKIGSRRIPVRRRDKQRGTRVPCRKEETGHTSKGDTASWTCALLITGQ